MTSQLSLPSSLMREPPTPKRPKGGQALRILEMLEAGPVTSGDFAGAYMLRYSARILELRRAGWRIKTLPLEGVASHLYVLER